MGNASSRGFAQGRPTCAPPARTLEVRTNGDADPLKQYPPSPDGYGGTGVWDLRYIDAPVLRWRDEDTDGTVDDTLYYLNDANFNVTAVVDGSDGDVVERYAYDPYGQVTVLNGEDDADGGGVSEWSADADNLSDWDNRIGYCGYRLDPETGADGQGIMHVRWRPYLPPLGRWTRRDPLNRDTPAGGYHDGMGLYTYVRSIPIGATDPKGNVLVVMAAWAQNFEYMQTLADAVGDSILSRLSPYDAPADLVLGEHYISKGPLIDNGTYDTPPAGSSEEEYISYSRSHMSYDDAVRYHHEEYVQRNKADPCSLEQFVAIGHSSGASAIANNLAAGHLNDPDFPPAYLGLIDPVLGEHDLRSVTHDGWGVFVWYQENPLALHGSPVHGADKNTPVEGKYVNPDGETSREDVGHMNLVSDQRVLSEVSRGAAAYYHVRVYVESKTAPSKVPYDTPEEGRW